MKGEYQSGCSLVGAIRNSAPSDDWCSVESITPNDGEADRDLARPTCARFVQPSHSKTRRQELHDRGRVGRGTTHQAISNITDGPPHEKKSGTGQVPGPAEVGAQAEDGEQVAEEARSAPRAGRSGGTPSRPKM